MRLNVNLYCVNLLTKTNSEPKFNEGCDFADIEQLLFIGLLNE